MTTRRVLEILICGMLASGYSYFLFSWSCLSVLATPVHHFNQVIYYLFHLQDIAELCWDLFLILKTQKTPLASGPLAFVCNDIIFKIL